MPLPLVSVIIPVYNAERFVEETVRSVLASTYTNLEVVCMDDGSTDGSLALLRELAQKDDRVRALHRENGGVCRARNAAIAASRGEYIFPLDADDLLLPTFLEQAVKVLLADPEVKVVAPTAEFFGDRTGPWRLPPFTLRKEARKNILAASALYRRADFDRTEGYCAEIIAREDWEFWIAMLKDGGRVVRLPEVGLRYRFQTGGKRVSDRRLKRHVVEVLNRRHPEFFERELGGPLRYRRTWSRLINAAVRLFHPRRVHTEPGYEGLELFLKTLPVRFADPQGGRVVYRGRNELREFDTAAGRVVVKSFCRPNLINRVAYGLLRASKAERSCSYAALLRARGIGSPAPVGWCTVRSGLLFARSYYASLRSELPYTYIDLIKGRIARPEPYLRAIGDVAGRMHEAGMIHRDFSRGNLLLGEAADGTVRVELVDLNRIRFHAVSMAEGLKNFERLPATEPMKRALAEGYAAARGYDMEECLRRWPRTEDMASREAGERNAQGEE